MKTQTELLEELDHLKAEERWDDALKLLDLIEPVSDEEWFQELAGVPIDDEPLSAEDRRALDEAHAALDRRVKPARAGLVNCEG